MADSTASLFERLRLPGNPVASSGSTVICGRARFTVLTSRLIRLEWSENGQFEDGATFAFPTRYAKAPVFTYQQNDSRLELHTADLSLTYEDNGQLFDAQNLSIRFVLEGRRVTWTPGAVNTGNLRGTRRTLDQCISAAGLQEGLLSRDGWSLVDDSGSPVWDREGRWVQARPDSHLQDWYFFGYGHDYKTTLADYIQFGGPIPLVPRYVLGVWWSRYWAYHADDLKQLVRDFEAHDVPLDVLVVDMDWHLPDGWTGYTWNRTLFPDPEAFLAWAHRHELYVTLNLHPADGVRKFEAAYPQFCELLGVDPASGEGIPFRCTDKTFVQHYFEVLHHPMEAQGVDFWWMDWQQGEATDIKNLDPLPWLNHLHFRDSARRGNRSMLYSRWGGLGNHRYPIGFSGDTYATWDALRFQPYFTATAANVCYGWWSHDIGGHFGATDPELYVRWVQFGAVSPCLRLHSNNNPLAERRPWAFPDPVFEAARAAMQFRYRLFPYLYSAARHASVSGLSLCTPMYYDYPDAEDAYLARGQYFLGDQMFVAPIVSPADPRTGLATFDVWIPPGEWIDYTTLETFTGPRWVQRCGDLNRIPMFVKAGAIVPMAPHLRRTKDFDGSRLVLTVFPGDGAFEFYEDDGTTDAYRQGEYEITAIQTATRGGEMAISVSGAQGKCSGLPARRTLELRVRGLRQPVDVTINAVSFSDWQYDPATLELVIAVPEQDRRRAFKIKIKASEPISCLGAARNRKLILEDVTRLAGLAQPPVSVEAALQATSGSDAAEKVVARSGGPFVHILDYETFEDTSRQLGTVLVAPPVDNTPFDVELEWTLHRGNVTTSAPVVLKHCTGTQVLHSPFADDGSRVSYRWQVAVRVRWAGTTLVYRHQSRDAYPSISHWRTLVYNREETPLTLQDMIRANGSLVWDTITQPVPGTPNVRQPFGIFLLENQRERITTGEPLEACLQTPLYSDSDSPQSLVLEVQCVGEHRCTLNGLDITPVDPVPTTVLDPMFAAWMNPVSTYYVLTLQPGENTLVLFTRPRPTMGWWGIGAALFDQAGQVVSACTDPQHEAAH